MKKYLKYIITFGIGLVAFIAIILSKRLFQQTELDEIYKILSDASFVPAVVIGGVGIIVFVDNNGVFDIIIYGVKLALTAFSRDINKRKYKTFYDYRVAKHETSHPYGFLLLVGGFFLVISVIFLILYMNVE